MGADISAAGAAVQPTVQVEIKDMPWVSALIAAQNAAIALSRDCFCKMLVIEPSPDSFVCVKSGMQTSADHIHNAAAPKAAMALMICKQLEIFLSPHLTGRRR